MATTDFERHGRFAVCNPESEEPTISPMTNPNDWLTGMDKEEAKQTLKDLDNALESMV